MKIKTWISYAVPYIPPRCRKERYDYKEEYVAVNLKEADPSEMQLAFEDVSYEGRVRIFYHVKTKALWRVAEMKDICAGGSVEHGYTTPLEALMWWNEHGSKYLTSLYDKVQQTRDTVMKRVRADMQTYLLIDGVLYVRTTVPYYKVVTFGLGQNYGGTGLLVQYTDYGKRPIIDNARYFDALSGKAAVEKANQIAANRGDTKDIGRFKEMIIVYMPELVKEKYSKRRTNK